MKAIGQAGGGARGSGEGEGEGEGEAEGDVGERYRFEARAVNGAHKGKYTQIINIDVYIYILCPSLT